jgi:hypothetical protein
VTQGTARAAPLRKLDRQTVQAGESERTRGERVVFANRDELRAAVVEVTSLANRGLAILTPDLEPDIYDHDDFLETLKRFVLAKPFARIRVLITQPERAMKSGNQFVQMGRRLNSYIEFRSLRDDQRPHDEAFCIADNRAIVYRARSDSGEGMVDTHAPAVASEYLKVFDALWQEC